MQDLMFALDGLYASGWWPADGDHCLQSQDGRWYPNESMIMSSFAMLILSPRIVTSSRSGAVEIIWTSSRFGQHRIHGRSREEALIIAFTTLYQESFVGATTR